MLILMQYAYTSVFCLFVNMFACLLACLILSYKFHVPNMRIHVFPVQLHHHVLGRYLNSRLNFGVGSLHAPPLYWSNWRIILSRRYNTAHDDFWCVSYFPLIFALLLSKQKGCVSYFPLIFALLLSKQKGENKGKITHTSEIIMSSIISSA